MMSRKQHLWRLQTAPIRRARILRILQQTAEMAFFLKAGIIGKHAGNQSADAVCENQGRQLAAGKNIIPRGEICSST